MKKRNMKKIFSLIVAVTVMIGMSCTSTTTRTTHKSIKMKQENVQNSIDISKNNLKNDTINMHCNMLYLTKLYNNIENPSNDDIENFLLTFDNTCQSKVEYLEFSNELLFDILNRYPDKVINILSKNKNINLNIILDELKTPINDRVDIKEIVNKTRKINNDISRKIVQVLLSIP